MPSRHIEPGQSHTNVHAVSYYGKGARRDAVSAWPVSIGQRSIGIGATMSTGTPGGGQPFPGPADAPVDAIVLRMLLGAQLRRLREDTDITSERAGHEIRASRSKISRL